MGKMPAVWGLNCT